MTRILLMWINFITIGTVIYFWKFRSENKQSKTKKVKTFRPILKMAHGSPTNLWSFFNYRNFAMFCNVINCLQFFLLQFLVIIYRSYLLWFFAQNWKKRLLWINKKFVCCSSTQNWEILVKFVFEIQDSYWLLDVLSKI